jgi:Hydrolytic ATP binding site of dynein motor region
LFNLFFNVYVYLCFHFLDFGLRNISSVLRTAGIKRRAQKKLTEMYALVQALRAVNMPKLVTEDATLFNSLIEDLFPQQPQGITDEERRDERRNLYLFFLLTTI